MTWWIPRCHQAYISTKLNSLPKASKQVKNGENGWVYCSHLWNYFETTNCTQRMLNSQITQEHLPKNVQVIWNVQFITVFVPAWMIPPIYHSLRRECIKNATHSHEIGVRSVRPTWFEFEDWKVPPRQEPTAQPGTFQPMHGLKLVIKEDVLPQDCFFWSAPFAFRRVTTWGLLADQRGIEPPPAVCQRYKSAAIPTEPRGHLGCLTPGAATEISRCWTTRWKRSLSSRHLE